MPTTQKIIKSPLRYPGGKSRVAKNICAMIPKDFLEFREPFFGGGSVTFFMIQQKPNAIYIANDIDYNVFAFWQCLKYLHRPLIQKIRDYKTQYEGHGKELYQELLQKETKAVFRELPPAIRFFIMNRITFSGTTDAGGYSEQAFQYRFTNSSINRLRQAARIAQFINFYNDDYKKWLEKPGKKVFIFLDPPYHSAKQSALYGKNGKIHKNFDHTKLAFHLHKCPHKWLMTIDDHPDIHELYKKFYIKKWSLQYGMNNIGGKKAEKGNELIITNYKI